mgnify:CR=1 FL=1
MANWDEGGPFYIPNITKITVAAIVLFYFLFRGVVFPIKKGVKWHALFPVKFILVFCLSGLLDLDKLIAFTQATFTKMK